MKLLPYKMASQGAKALAEALNVKRLKLINSSYTPRQPITVINWGTSAQKVPDRLYRNTNVSWINPPDKVTVASNKLLSFQCLKTAGVSIPEFTIEFSTAYEWHSSGIPVVSRYKLNGHSGEGIDFDGGRSLSQVSGGEECPLYVKYIKKSAEYRVHLFDGQVIDVQQKRKRRDMDNDDVDYQVRSHANGWIFCREDVTAPQSVLDESIKAVVALGLDFGAVDVIWNDHYQRAYVLEVNTAPGLEGTTLEKYKETFSVRRAEI